MQNFGVVFLSAMVIFLGGCAHKRVLESPIQPVEPAQFWQDQAARRTTLTAFTGKLKMGYEGKKQDVSGKGRILGQLAGSFRLELRDPLGRLHYVLTNKQLELVGYYPRNHQAFRDSTGGKAYFKRVLGIAIPFSEMVCLFAGTLPPRWEKAKLVKWEWDKEKGAFQGIWEQGGETITAWVDSGNKAMQALVWKRLDQTIEADFADYDSCCKGRTDFALAFETKVRIPSEQTAVQVTWESLAPSTQEMPVSAFEFQPGPGDKLSEIK